MAREAARTFGGEVLEVLRKVVAFTVVVLILFAVVISLALFAGIVVELWLSIPIRETIPPLLQTSILLASTIALGAWLAHYKTSDTGIVQTVPIHVPELQDVALTTNYVREKRPSVFERETNVQPEEEQATPVQFSIPVPQLPSTASQSPQSPRRNVQREIPEPSPTSPTPPPSHPDTFWTPRVQGQEDLTHPVVRETLIPPQPVEQHPENVQVRFTLPDQIMTRISDVSFKCSFCGSILSLPWERVEQSEKGEKVTIDCPYCQGHLAFESVVGKTLTLNIHPA